MSRWLLGLVLCLGCSCGRQAQVASELAPLWEEFGERVAYAGDVPGKFVDKMEGDDVGVCETKTLGGKVLWKRVSILRSAWDSYSADLRKELVFHELGHCVLGLEHDETLGSDGRPESIMFPRVFEMGEREDALVRRLQP